MNQITDTSSFALLPHETGFDPIEERLRMNVRADLIPEHVRANAPIAPPPPPKRRGRPPKNRNGVADH